MITTSTQKAKTIATTTEVTIWANCLNKLRVNSWNLNISRDKTSVKSGKNFYISRMLLPPAVVMANRCATPRQNSPAKTFVSVFLCELEPSHGKTQVWLFRFVTPTPIEIFLKGKHKLDYFILWPKVLTIVKDDLFQGAALWRFPRLHRCVRWEWLSWGEQVLWRVPVQVRL